MTNGMGGIREMGKLANPGTPWKGGGEDKQGVMRWVSGKGAIMTGERGVWGKRKRITVGREYFPYRR
jgi:hypothetical protein